MQDDQKAKNILTSGLYSDEFFHTARCKSAKEIRKMLEVSHEGTMDVRMHQHMPIINVQLYT